MRRTMGLLAALALLAGACGNDDGINLSTAFDVDGVLNCGDLADASVDTLQLLLDEIGTRSVQEYYAEGETIQENWVASLEQQGYLQLDTRAQELGCTAQMHREALVCERLAGLSPHGPGGEDLIGDLISACEALPDPAALAGDGIVDTVQLPGDSGSNLPVDLAADAAAVWVADFNAGYVLKIDPEELRIAATSSRIGATRLMPTPDGVWSTCIDSNSVVHVGLDATTIEWVDVGTSPIGVTLCEDAVWVVNQDDASVTRIDPNTHEATATIAVDTALLSYAACGGGVLWVTAHVEDVIYRIDPATNQVISEPTQTGASPGVLVTSTTDLWVANDDGTISRVDLDSAAVISTIRIGTGRLALALGGDGMVWAAEGDTVYRLDPASETVSGVARVPGSLIDVAAAGDAVWVLWGLQTDDTWTFYVSRVHN